jgi:hypothetical protein
MKKIFLILTGLILTSSIHGQIKKPIDPTYFILGTLSDYNGRFWSIKKTNQVDRYNSYEKPLIDDINALSRKKLKIIVGTTVDYSSPTLEFETFSKDLSSKLNSFYSKNKLLNESLLKDSVQIYSFLLGRYYRYGSKLNEKIYVLRFPNFPNHVICNNLLKRIGCKVYFKHIEKMPSQYIYYFIPTQELKRYIDTITEQKARLEDSYNTYYKSLWGMTNDEYIKNTKGLLEKEFSEILTNFK